MLRKKVIALIGIVEPRHMGAFVPWDLFSEVPFQSTPTSQSMWSMWIDLQWKSGESRETVYGCSCSFKICLTVHVCAPDKPESSERGFWAEVHSVWEVFHRRLQNSSRNKGSTFVAGASLMQRLILWIQEGHFECKCKSSSHSVCTMENCL